MYSSSCCPVGQDPCNHLHDVYIFLARFFFFPGLDLYCADPARSLTAAGEELLTDDLDHDLYVQAVKGLGSAGQPLAAVCSRAPLHQYTAV